MKFSKARRKDLEKIYATAEEARITVAIVHAARLVRDLNYKYLQEGRGALVTARFGKDGITILDPIAGPGKMAQLIYDKPL
jgi:hypothetical protein